MGQLFFALSCYPMHAITKYIRVGSFVGAMLLCLFCEGDLTVQTSEVLIYHTIQTNRDGNIIPWYDPDTATAYDHGLYAVWNFWHTMRRDLNGLPYYMNHQVWNPELNGGCIESGHLKPRFID